MNASSSELEPVWVVIPAAGLGARMGGVIPKQYLPLAGKTLLQVTLEKMLMLRRLAGVVVALSPDDAHWPPSLDLHPQIHRVTGGQERADSVLNGLSYLVGTHVSSSHWVLVHDAARPCVLPERIERLRREVQARALPGQTYGGILAKPVADTLKRASQGLVQETCDRSQLWQAHTPQMFRLGDLHQALQQGLAAGRVITDEASAVEQYGGHVCLVEDQRDNIKVTHPEDLPLVEMILRRQLEQEDVK